MSTEDVPQEFVDAETKAESEKEDMQSKPEQIRCAPPGLTFAFCTEGQRWTTTSGQQKNRRE